MIDSSQIIALFAVFVSLLGWLASYWFNVRAVDIARRRDFQLKIYGGLVDRTNELVKSISSYTVNSKSHTNIMARLLDDYVVIEKPPKTKESVNRVYDLKLEWLTAAHSLSNQSFKVQKDIEDYLRYLDVNGTDYVKGTPLYGAMQIVKQDAYNAAESNRKRWSDSSEMDTINRETYNIKSEETNRDANIIFEFSQCLDDVLLSMYNSSTAEYLKKPKKELDMTERRRYVTEQGLIDNRHSEDN